MSDEKTQKSLSGKKPKAKIVLILLIVVAAVVVYMFQQRRLTIEGWCEDLPQALQQAKKENRRVVVFFANDPPSAIALRIKNKIIARPENRKALTAGNYVKAIVYLDNALTTKIARQYKITKLPTLMVLNSDGTERNRNAGDIGELLFRQQFLDFKPAK